MSRFPIALVVMFLLAPTPMARAAGAILLEDSTTVDSWRLSNGLEVRVREVPGATSVAITLAYRAGSFIEPEPRPGLSELLAQLQFLAPAGEIPERSLAEMSSLRPLGWGVTTNARLTLLTEVASREHFAGLLRQVATRARGVQVGDSCFRNVLAGVRRVLTDRSFGAPEPTLYERLRDLSRGWEESQILNRASGRGLEGLKAADVLLLLRRYYVPSNAALALVGDFGGMELRTLLEKELGSIPPGDPQPDPPSLALVGGSRASQVSGLELPVAAVGVAAPALEDTLHPKFLMSALIFGSWWKKENSPVQQPFTSYFQYSVLDEPELAHFNLNVGDGTTTPAAVQAKWLDAVERFAAILITGEVLDGMRRTVTWILGGPLPPNLRRAVPGSPPAMATLANGMATRALWRGDEFWSAYRQRFEAVRISPTSFRAWMRAPEHLSILLLHPKR